LKAWAVGVANVHTHTHIYNDDDKTYLLDDAEKLPINWPHIKRMRKALQSEPHKMGTTFHKFMSTH